MEISVNEQILKGYYLGFKVNGKAMYPYDYEEAQNAIYIGSFTDEEESLTKHIFTLWNSLGLLMYSPKIICTDVDNLSSYKFTQLEWFIEKGIKKEV